MDFLRESFDEFYDFIKPAVFRLTQHDPQVAHEWFLRLCNVLHTLRLERLVLNNSSNSLFPEFELSNAAGFNKNGDFHPRVLHYLGFDRVVVGTVTYDPWNGNPRPTIRRYPEVESMVNWMGLPGIGARAVAEKLERYGDHEVPLTINLMATPGKQGDEILRDVRGTVLATRNLPYFERFELNISCPNTHGNDGKDMRRENLQRLDDLLTVLEDTVYGYHQIYVKVSPDSTEADVDDTLEVSKDHRRGGVTVCNTTTQHHRSYIPVSPMVDGKQVGGASGNAVHDFSLRVQKLYDKKRTPGMDLIACGGINSLERVSQRLEHGATGIQLYTPLVFSGPKLLRELRQYNS